MEVFKISRRHQTGLPTRQIFQFISRKLSGTLTGALEPVQVNLDILLPTYCNHCNILDTITYRKAPFIRTKIHFLGSIILKGQITSVLPRRPFHIHCTYLVLYNNHNSFRNIIYLTSDRLPSDETH